MVFSEQIVLHMNILLLVTMSISSFIAPFIGGFFLAFLLISMMPGLFSGWLKRQQRMMNDELEHDSEIPEDNWKNPGNHSHFMYFFLGQSGCGKDTQVSKILEQLTLQGIPYLYVSIGDEVRGLIEQLGKQSYFAQAMKSVNDQGKLQPASLPIHFFMKKFIPGYTGKQVIIVNGSPRSFRELQLWSALISVGYLPNAKIINIDVTDDECRKRLKMRPGRPDTEDAQALENKLAWYKPIRIWLIKKLPLGVEVVTIDGVGSIEATADQIYDVFAKDGVLG